MIGHEVTCTVTFTITKLITTTATTIAATMEPRVLTVKQQLQNTQYYSIVMIGCRSRDINGLRRRVGPARTDAAGRGCSHLRRVDTNGQGMAQVRGKCAQPRERAHTLQSEELSTATPARTHTTVRRTEHSYSSGHTHAHLWR